MNTEPAVTTSVGLVTIATGRYTEFIPQLVASARKHLLGLGPVFVLTDATSLPIVGEVRLLPWEKTEWPLPTLLRYRGFTKYAAVLSSVDVLLYTDADMLFVGDVDIREASGLIAVQHPGYSSTLPSDLPYERRSESAACVPQGQGSRYYCGGVQGGLASTYLATATAIDRAIALDEEHGITAVWHDESHWNRYLADHPASMNLDDNYCTPDVARKDSSKILALTKDHAYFREYRLGRRIDLWIRGRILSPMRRAAKLLFANARRTSWLGR